MFSLNFRPQKMSYLYEFVRNHMVMKQQLLVEKLEKNAKKMPHKNNKY